MSVAVETTPDLCLLLAQASHALNVELAARLEQIGSSPRTYCVLSTALSGEFTQVRIAELCGLDKTTMVSTIDELEAAGLAERRPSATDRRARIIAVTTTGKRLVAKSREIVVKVYDDVLSSLPARQREAFVAGLSGLVSGPLAEPSQCVHKPRRPRTA